MEPKILPYNEQAHKWLREVLESAGAENVRFDYPVFETRCCDVTCTFHGNEIRFPLTREDLLAAGDGHPDDKARLREKVPNHFRP